MPPARFPRRFLLLSLAGLVCAFAITSESLWIDELMTAYLVTSDTWKLFREHTASLNTSDIQMPLYMTYVWGWHQLFGGSELALRLANIPWLLFGLYGFWRFLRDSPRTRDLALLVLLFSPFTWFYLNEARPYAMQLGSSCVVLALATRLIASWKDGVYLNAGDLYTGTFGLSVLVGSTLLGVPWGAAFLALFAVGLVRKSFTCANRPLLVSAATSFVLLAGFGLYYLGTLMDGARAATLSGHPLSSFAYALYELLGFAGLGPGRNDLRAASISGIFRGLPLWQLALLGLLAVLHGILACRFARQILLPSRFGEKTRAWLLLVVPPLVFMVLLAFLKDFRVLGRHLTPLLPLVCIYLAVTFNTFTGRQTNGMIAGALLTLLLTSSVMQRFAPRHRKEDYRQAAALASSEVEKGRSVLWVASLAARPYYHLDKLGYLPVRPDAASPPFLHVFRIGHEDPVFLPSLVLVSKPDIHDPTGYAEAFIRNNRYQLRREFPGFKVYAR